MNAMYLTQHKLKNSVYVFELQKTIFNRDPAYCVKGVKRDHRDVFHLGFGQSSFLEAPWKRTSYANTSA